jgi:hypothetical protein
MNLPARAIGGGRAKTASPILPRFVILLLALPFCAVARTSSPTTPLSQLLACRLIAADAARLTCFDRTSAALAHRPALPAAQPPQAPSAAMKAALNPQGTFGLSHATIAQREAAAAGLHVKEAPNITARIVRMGQDPEGRAILALDNGQVWEQLVADGTNLYTKVGDSVRISRGWLDSYWLETPSHHACKVTRLR